MYPPNIAADHVLLTMIGSVHIFLWSAIASGQNPPGQSDRSSRAGIRSILLIALFLWSGHSGSPLAQEITFEHLDETQGLTSSNLYRLYQDHTGYLWTCTINGLYRYDGLTFNLYRSDPSKPDGLSEDFVKQYIEDLSGNGLAITDNGQLFVLTPDEQAFRRVLLPAPGKGPDPVRIRQMAVDGTGRIWVIASGLGLLQLDLAHSTLTTPSGIGKIAPQVRIMAADPESGDLWFIADSTLYVLPERNADGQKMEVRSVIAIGDTRLNDLMVDRTGKIWLAGYGDEVICVDPIQKTTRGYPYQQTRPDDRTGAPNRVNTVVEDQDGQIWIGTNYAGILRLDPLSGEMTSLSYDRNDPESLSSNTVTDIFCDRTGIIWVATWGKSLNKFVPAKAQFGHIRSVATDPFSLSDPLVTAFYEQPDGNVWIGTDGGMHLLDNRSGRIRRFPFPKDLFRGRENTIYAIQPVSPADDRLWLGTTLGLLRFDPAGGTYANWKSPDPEGLPLERNIVYYLITDDRGQLWAVSYSPYQLFQYHPDRDRFSAIDVIDKVVLSGEDPVVIADWQHHVWIGTPNGRFYRYDVDEQKLQAFQLPPGDTSGLQTRQIGHFHTDRKDRLWLGSTTGLYRIVLDAAGQITNVRRFSERDGLAGPQVMGILEDARGYLWLCTNKGISTFDPETLVFHHFDRSDGLQANEFGFGACHRGTATGRFYFGGINGMNHFHPNQIILDTITPTVVLTGVQVIRGDETVQVAGWTRTGQPARQVLQLHYDDKVITFGFAALHYADPASNQIAYRMEGFDPGWRLAGNQHQATYTNLDPGTYTFRVRASNKDGIWNETGTAIQLTILPPWWTTWWAMVLYLVTFAGLVTALFRYQVHRNRERSEARRFRELDQVKTRLYTNITHEFRTPLTVISGMAGMIEQPAEARDMIQRNANSLLHLINQILDLAKLESGQMPLELVCIDIVPYVQYITETFQSFAASRNLTLVAYPECKQLEMDIDEKKLFSILSNLLSNAIKFTPTGGKIIVHLRQDKDQMVLKVKDTGQGIPSAHLPFIFDRFYQVDPSATRKEEGTGIGLTLSRELVELMHGQISVNSQVGEGTEFTLTIPITTRAQRGTAEWHEELVPGTILPPPKAVTTDPTIDDDNQPRLLLIEDNPDVAIYIRRCLENLFQVDIATNGEAGLQLAFQTIPDLVISDVMMPEKDGFEVCDTLKRDERTSHIPVILLTARADMDSRLTGLSRGADAYLTKPFVREELRIRVQKLLELRSTLQQRYASIQKAESEVPDPAIAESVDGQFLLKVRQLILDNLGDESFGNAQLASRIHLSESQLFRKIKALTGTSTALFIRQIRLHQARQMLLSSDKTVAEIAFEVGFSDPAYFSRTFSQEFGASPNAIRK